MTQNELARVLRTHITGHHQFYFVCGWQVNVTDPLRPTTQADGVTAAILLDEDVFGHMLAASLVVQINGQCVLFGGSSEVKQCDVDALAWNQGMAMHVDVMDRNTLTLLTLSEGTTCYRKINLGNNR